MNFWTPNNFRLGSGGTPFIVQHFRIPCGHGLVVGQELSGPELDDLELFFSVCAEQHGLPPLSANPVAQLAVRAGPDHIIFTSF